MRISDWSSDVCSSDLQEFDKEFVDGVRDVDRLIGNFDKMDTEWKRFVDFAFGHPQIFVQLEAIELGPHVDAQHKRGLPIIEYSKGGRSEEHTSELQSLMRISYAVFCLKKKTKTISRRHK